MRLRRGETVRAPSSSTDSEFAERNCDHLRRPRCALGRSALPVIPRRKAGRAAAGAQIITRRSAHADDVRLETM